MENLRTILKMRRISPADIIWDVSRNAKSIFLALQSQHPKLQNQFLKLQHQIPTPRSCSTFKWKHYLRPHGHFRAFYLQFSENNVLAFKGFDIFTQNLPQKLAELRKLSASGGISMLQFLIDIERKIPMAMTLSEALQEAQMTAEFQSAYLKRYGKFARMPIPLFVYCWRPDLALPFKKTLLSNLSLQERKKTISLLNEGLGALVYFYPAIPLRVRHIAQAAHQTEQENLKDRFQRQKIMASVFGDWPTPQETISRWITLTARILTLGYSPYRISHPHNGHCIQEQNAVLDGGFADINSLQPITEITNDARFFKTCLMTLQCLSSTINRFLNGYNKEYDSTSHSIFSRTQPLILRQTRQALMRRLKTEGRDSATTTQRLLRAFSNYHKLKNGNISTLKKNRMPPGIRD